MLADLDPNYELFCCLRHATIGTGHSLATD
jgi:hypothetical protein